LRVVVADGGEPRSYCAMIQRDETGTRLTPWRVGTGAGSLSLELAAAVRGGQV
jgi:hypothetical protein